MNKKYKAIFFDWDGTAVTSRTAPVEDAVVAMKPLLGAGVTVGMNPFNLSNTLYVTSTSFSYVLLRLNRRLQTESTAPFNFVDFLTVSIE